MAHGTNAVIKRGVEGVQVKPDTKTGAGSRRIFAPQFKIQVLDSYRWDSDCKGNQRATARKYNIHRRQIQKWLQMEDTLRRGVVGGKQQQSTQTVKNDVSLNNNHRLNRQPGDESSDERSASMAGDAPIITEVGTPAGWPAYQSHHTYTSDYTDYITPIDLSLKRPITPQQLHHGSSSESSFTLSSPSSNCTIPCEYYESSPYLKSDSQVGVWDLSTKNSKRKAENDNSDNPSPKTVKLFKPYLDVITGDEDASSSETSDKSIPSPSRISNGFPPPLRQCFFHSCCICQEPKLSYSNYILHEPKNGLPPLLHTYFNPEYPDCLGPYDTYEDALVPIAPMPASPYDSDFKYSSVDHCCSDGSMICQSGSPIQLPEKYVLFPPCI